MRYSSMRSCHWPWMSPHTVTGAATGWYFYRFHSGTETSPTGRTRTAPALDALPESLRFAFTSCQHYEVGYFNGYPHMQQEDLDLVVANGENASGGRGIDPGGVEGGLHGVVVGERLDERDEFLGA